MKYCVIILLTTLLSCKPGSDQMEKLKKEIVATEKAFALMAKNEGIEKAFLHFADEHAVLNRNNTLFKGKEAIKKYFASHNPGDAQLTWEPDFVEVAASGDMGYTYGKYVHASTDSLGNITETTGIFHTVWKRQKDGSWKFVWD